MIDTRGAGTNRRWLSLPALARDTATTLRRPRSETAGTATGGRSRGEDRRRLVCASRGRPSTEPGLERRLDAFDTWMTHLELALEGLQDALYRQAVREDGSVADLRERRDSDRVEALEAEARYARERYDRYRATTYGPRPASLARLRELQRIHEGAEAQLGRARQAQAAKAGD